MDTIALGITRIDLVETDCLDAANPPVLLPVIVLIASVTMPKPTRAAGLLAGSILPIALLVWTGRICEA